jgi:hypothetical protein
MVEVLASFAGLGGRKEGLRRRQGFYSEEALRVVAYSLSRQGKYAEAEKMEREVLAVRKPLFPPSLLFLSFLLFSLFFFPCPLFPFPSSFFPSSNFSFSN